MDQYPGPDQTTGAYGRLDPTGAARPLTNLRGHSMVAEKILRALGHFGRDGFPHTLSRA